MGGWTTNAREVATDPKDDGSVHLFNAAEVLELLEMSGLKKLAGLLKRAKVRPHSGRGKGAMYSYKQINALAEVRKTDKDYDIRPVRSCGPVYRGA